MQLKVHVQGIFHHLSAFLIFGEPRKLINQTGKFAGETITGKVYKKNGKTRKYN